MKMEQFITMVRQMPCLWDMESRDYRDMRKKDIAWMRIVEELKRKDIPDVKTAKAEWKKLRDSHRDSLKRARALSSGDDGVVINKWKYADIMDFLLPYMKSRKRRRQFTTSSEENDIRESCTSPADSFSVQPSTSHIDNATFDSSIEKTIDTTQHIDHKFRKRKVENEFSEVMIQMEDRNGTHYPESSKHPLDSFFESMCETTKQFPTWLQYSVKRKIFNVISEAEDTFETYKSRETIF